MSLICVLRTQHGIVMSADRRLTIDVSRETGDSGTITRREVITDHEQKLFQIGDYGVAYYGDSSGKENMSLTIKRFAETADTSKGARAIAQSLMNSIRSVHGDGIACKFFLCGFDKGTGDGIILECAVNTSSIVTQTGPFVAGGDTDNISEILRPLMSTSLTDPYSRPAYNNGNAKDFLTFVIRTAASYQRFAGLAQSISEECDLLVLPRPLV